MQVAKGFTLCELLITISILSIMLTIVIPTFQHVHTQIRAYILYQEVFTLIQYTRSIATSSGQTAVLCPTQDQENCINNWAHPLIVFIDHNENQKRDKQENISLQSNLLVTGEKFVWRAFGSSRYMRFIADGTTEHQSGNFSICLDNNVPIQQIKLHKTGRARKARKEEIRVEYCDS